MKLSDLSNRTVTVAMPFGDAGDKLVARPNAISSNFLVDLTSLDESARTKEEIQAQLDRAAQLLCQVVVRWDLTDDDGNPIAVTPASMQENNVPFVFVMACIRAAVQSVGEAVAPAS